MKGSGWVKDDRIRLLMRMGGSGCLVKDEKIMLCGG
jgi:hypothetical protein